MSRGKMIGMKEDSRAARRAGFRRRQIEALLRLRSERKRASTLLIPKELLERCFVYDDEYREKISPHQEEEFARTRRKARKLAYATMSRDARVPR